MKDMVFTPTFSGAGRVDPVTYLLPRLRANERSSSLLKNTVRAERSGVSHGVEACKPLIDFRPVFRLRFPESILSFVEGLNTNGF
jgi:hypothetical protein